jgi:hypothetical protein
MAYYVRVATRGSAATGSPRQALNYITDGHDARRDPSYSDAELHYIARMDPGWKADLEGGRVPLVGFGELTGERDEERLAARFEDACQPYHDRRGTTGYKSITLTVPKEVSLYAEGHRGEAKAAINAAIKQSMDRAFAGFRYSAVAAIHTRNEAGEIHYHAHVLVGKFARSIETGRLVSLNSTAGKNYPARVREMKIGWQEGIDKEFRERLQLGIEQKSPHSSVALVLPDGSRLEPLNRESRRVLEKQLCPTYSDTGANGKTITRHFRWSAMDDRIFEIASGARGTSAWSKTAFTDLFPEQSRYLSRYEARVRTLKAIGYLSPEGQIQTAFRVHFAAHHGVLTPELQRVRLDLLQKLARERSASTPPPIPGQFWAQIQRYENLRRRIERLGYDKGDVEAVFARAAKQKPSRAVLDGIRREVQRHGRLAPLPSKSPATKNILRAYVDLQKSRVHRIYLLSSGIVEPWKLSGKLALAAQLKRVAERDFFFAKEKRLAQLGRGLRPVIWLVRVAMPKEARRLDLAIVRCARLAQLQQLRKAEREQIKKAYDRWHADFIKRPLADLKKESQELARPAQQAARPTLEKAKAALQLADTSAAVSVFRRGYTALADGNSKDDLAALRPWVGKEEHLVAEVHAHSKGEPSSLNAEQYAAAVRVGHIGQLLTAADAAPETHVPNAFADQKSDVQRLAGRLNAFGLRNPLSPTNLSALAPAQLRQQLDKARQAGLLGDGADWTRNAAGARSFTQQLTREIDQAKSVERLLEDRLIHGTRRQP